MDYYWACNRTGRTLDHKQRVSTTHALDDYSLVNYISYVLYAPLYIAGPIITFNDFMWQLRRPLQLNIRDTFGYLIRFIGCFLTMECILHFMYMVAIKDTNACMAEALDTVAILQALGFAWWHGPS
ncbi:hypothetical protein EW026_g1057 [Hermanssonia centrifuga]|uniref:Uncharacterized protein n=1 Tax=Hermanssonia centrifuga TaxID=98765 RepID=A0A4S4KUH8_9APHY|nr:hypothetical protein EW026_g1057 [Hermanssonia centrifuga]